MNFLMIVVSLLFGPNTALGGGEDLSLLKSMRTSFTSGPGVRYRTVKTVKGMLRTKKFTGELTIQNGKFHWLNSQPTKTLQLFDGKGFYSVQYPIAKGETPQVVRVKSVTTEEGVLSLIQDKRPIDKVFAIEKVAATQVKLTAKTKDVNVKFFVLTFAQGKVRNIQYTDDLDNQTSIELTEVELPDKLAENFFVFIKPKGAKVVDR